MAQIHNADTIKRILDDGGIQTSREDPPTQLASKIVPVLIANPKPNQFIAKSGFSSTTGTTTVYTTPAGKDFYLTSATLSVQENVTSDGVVTYLSAIIDGETRRILQLSKITLTVFQETISLTFNPALKLDRSSAINMTNGFTVGAATKSSTITGYLL